MALILEIREARGTSRSHRLDSLPITIGRAVSNDVIIDDPYIDAHHARIALNESGAITIADLGTVNGLFFNGVKSLKAIDVQAGTEVRVGQTTLRFAEIVEAVAPAIAHDDSARIPGALALPVQGIHAEPILPQTQRNTFTTKFDRKLDAFILNRMWQRILAVGLMMTLFAFNASTVYSARSVGAAGTVAAIISVLFASIWAALWSMSNRGLRLRDRFTRHLAVFACSAILFFALFTIEDWGEFLSPATGVAPAIASFLLIALLFFMIMADLHVADVRHGRTRWMIAGSLVAIILLPVVLISTTSRKTRGAKPEFISTLKPLRQNLIPANSVDEFGSALKDLKILADSEAAKPPTH